MEYILYCQVKKQPTNNLIKDADALDRFCLGPSGFDSRYLRTPESKLRQRQCQLPRQRGLLPRIRRLPYLRALTKQYIEKALDLCSLLFISPGL